jgi:hypothetical protein
MSIAAMMGKDVGFNWYSRFAKHRAGITPSVSSTG